MLAGCLNHLYIDYLMRYLSTFYLEQVGGYERGCYSRSAIKFDAFVNRTERRTSNMI